MKYFYQRDFNGFEHYYKFDPSNGWGIHVNTSSFCINSCPYIRFELNEITKEDFEKALDETIKKMGLDSNIKKFKFT